MNHYKFQLAIFFNILMSSSLYFDADPFNLFYYESQQFNKNNNYKANFITLFHKIENYGAKINKEKIRFGYSFSNNLTNLHKYSELLLKKNSYSFVRKV